MSQVIARIEHVRAEALCVAGARAWFVTHGLDFALFLRDGMPADELATFDDALAKRVAARAYAEAEHGLG